MRRTILLVLVAAVLSATPAVLTSSTLGAAHADGASTHPRLLFSAEDVPAIRARVTSGTRAVAWRLLRQRADAWSDPANPAYIDPQLVTDPTPQKNPSWALYTGFFGQNAMGTILADLGFAHVVSGEDRYGRHAIDLLLATARGGWRAWNNNELGEGDLTKGVGLAFDWTYDLMSDAERSEIVRSLTTHERSLFSCLYESWYPTSSPGYNWQSVCGGGNGLTLLAIAGEPGAPADIEERLAVARARIIQTFGEQINSQGDWDEGLNYMAYGMHNALPFTFAWERMRGEDLLAASPGIANVARHLAAEQLPGRGAAFVPRNDSPEYLPSMQGVIPLLFEAAPNGEVGWVWDRTVGPLGDDIYGATAEPAYVGTGVTGSPQCNPPEEMEQPLNAFFCWNSADLFTILYWRSAEELPRVSPAPDRLSTHHPEHGLVNMRTGFGNRSDVVATYEAKHHHRAGHSQTDVGQFTLYGHGSRFALDSGYGHNYSCQPGSAGAIVEGGCPRTDNGHGLGHNLLVLNGNRYTQRGDAVSSTVDPILGYLDSPQATVIRSDLRRSYEVDTTRIPEARRDLVFSRAPGEPVILAVRDGLNRNGGGRFSHQWRLHTDGVNVVLPAGAQSRLLATPTGATMTLGVAEVTAPMVLAYQPWHMRGASPTQQLVLSQTALDQARFDHLAVMAVTAPGAVPSTVASETATGGSVLRVSWLGGETIVASKAGPAASVTSLGLSTDAEMVKVNPSGDRLVFSHGSSLDVGGLRILRVTGGRGTVSSDGQSIVASGPAGASYRLRAPQGVGSVRLNGLEVDWLQDGDDVVFPRPDVTASFSSTTVAVKKNTTDSLAGELRSVNGFDGPVTLDVAGLPTGVSAVFAPSTVATVTPSRSAAFTLSLRPGPTARPGRSTFTLGITTHGRRAGIPVTFEILDDDALAIAGS